MRNTDFNIEALGNFISADAVSFEALKDLIQDLDLQFESASVL